MTKTIVTEKHKRRVVCPSCNAQPGQPCRSSRIPGANTFGGGWGGPPDLDTAHRERRAAYLAQPDQCMRCHGRFTATPADKVAICRPCLRR
jgi:hypothetical protein